MTKEHCKEIRDTLKEAFPRLEGWKISVRNEHHSGVRITILEAPVRFAEGDDVQINHHYLNDEEYDNVEILKYISNIANKGNHDRSDSQTDYFDVGWYVWMQQGDWDKPFKVNNPLNLK